MLFVRETRDHARLEAARHVPRDDGRHDHLHGDLTNRQVFEQTSFREPALSAASQAGMVNNLNDGLAWGLFPVLFASAGLSVARIGVLAALYPAVWGLGQLVTGALSDRWGRKWLIAGGMGLQGLALALVATSTGFTGWAVAAVLLGAGTAMVYPTLLAAIGDVAHPAWRARSVGVYRLWRDLGFAVGALLAGLLADAFGLRSAIWVIAALTLASGLVVAMRMYETMAPPGAEGRRALILRDSTQEAALPRVTIEQVDDPVVRWARAAPASANAVNHRSGTSAPRKRQSAASTICKGAAAAQGVSEARANPPAGRRYVASVTAPITARRPRPATHQTPLTGPADEA